jgi:tetratricopeptide (TPR) repeat protein
MAGQRRRKARQQELLSTAVQNGIDLHRHGRHAEAERICSDVLAIDDKHVDALHLLSVLKRAQGNPMEAVALLARALRAEPASVEVLADRAGMLMSLGRHEEALQDCERAVVLKPAYVDAWIKRGTALQCLGRLDASLESLDKAIALKPDSIEAWTNRGNTLAQLGRSEDAVASYDKALAVNDANATIWKNRAAVLRGLGRPGDALASYDKALALDPDNPNNVGIWKSRGALLYKAGRYDEAVASYERVLAVKPDDADAWMSRGNALRLLRRYDEALACQERAVALDPGRADVHSNRASVLLGLGRCDEALAGYDRALAIVPDHAEVLANRATALGQLGHRDDALACFRRALALRPDFPAATGKMGMLQLLMGDFREGWANNECRWHLPDASPNALRQAAPQWRGEPIAGKTIVLYAEQGLGDTIQFVRYAPMVTTTGARVILAVQAVLKRLVEQAAPQALVLVTGEKGPPFDLQCPLLSLPLAFGTELDTIPRDVPYVHADADRVAAWRSRLPAGGGKRVGLVWAGNSAHGNDRNRSIDLARLQPLFDAPGIQFVSLQRELRPGDAAILESSPNVAHVGDQLADFADTTALIECLDVVVAVDTSVAHLAGAMAKPVWILLPFSPDWRWLLGRDDSPWYPTARLFRQPATGDWDSVIARVRAELARL